MSLNAASNSLSIPICSTDLVKFAEKIKIPSCYLPRDTKCLFKNADEAEMWRHIILTIEPAFKIKEIRRNLIIKKIKNSPHSNVLSEELNCWHKKKEYYNKLEKMTTIFMHAQNELEVKIASAKLHERKRDYYKRSIESNNLKANIYKKKIENISAEINNLVKHTKQFDIVLSRNTIDLTDLSQKMLYLHQETKCFVAKPDDNNMLDSKIKEITNKIHINNIWEWFTLNEKADLTKLIALVENVNLTNDKELLKNTGKTMQSSITDLSVKNIKLNVKVMQNMHNCNQYQNEYLDFINNLDTQGQTLERNYVDTSLKRFFLFKKIQRTTELLNHLVKEGEVLNQYESKNLQLLNEIKNIDMDMKKIIKNIESFDFALYNIPKVLDIRNKNCDIIVIIAQSVKGLSELAQACNQYTQELQVFNEIDIMQLPLLIRRGSNKRSGHFLITPMVDLAGNTMKDIHLFIWESTIKFILRFLKEMKLYSLFKEKNNTVHEEFIPNIKDENYDFCNSTHNAQVMNFEKMQTKLKRKIKDVYHLIEFWSRNPLKNYICMDRLFCDKPYKYYEDSLMRYKQLL